MSEAAILIVVLMMLVSMWEKNMNTLAFVYADVYLFSEKGCFYSNANQ